MCNESSRLKDALFIKYITSVIKLKIKESNLSGSDIKVWAAFFISPGKEVVQMVNDEVNNKAINIEIKVAQYSAKAILKAMKKIIEDAAEKSQPLADYLSEKRKTNSRKLKDMVKKGQLENIDLQKGEVKELKNQLNRYGVNFSVMKNKVFKNKVKEKHHQQEIK